LIILKPLGYCEFRSEAMPVCYSYAQGMIESLRLCAAHHKLLEDAIAAEEVIFVGSEMEERILGKKVK
jgi:hypothetical protein